MADDYVTNPGAGGSTFRGPSEAGGKIHPAGVVEYITGGSAGAYTFQLVDLTHGQPVQPQTGSTWAATQSGIWSTRTQDGSGNAIDSSAATGGGTLAESLRGLHTRSAVYGWDSDITSFVPIAVDVGGRVTVTVFGPVSVSGTVTCDTELPAASQVTGDNVAAPTAPGVYTFGLYYDGANWDRVRGDSANGMLVYLGSNNTVVVSNTVAVSGPLTDAQLRATPVGVDTELPAAVALADNLANPTAPEVGACLLLWDGSQWLRGRGDATNGQKVQVTTVPADPFGANADAASATGSISAKLRFIAATGIPVTSVPANQTIDLNRVAGTGTATGNGTASAGCQRVTLASDNSDVPAKLQPQTSGGTTPYKYITSGAANQDSAAVKGSAGQLYSYSCFNTTASAKYVKFYDKASGATSSDTPKLVIMVPANSGANMDYTHAPAFASGICHRVTTGSADADTGVCSTGDVIVNATYK